jgi:hypothetical protein
VTYYDNHNLRSFTQNFNDGSGGDYAVTRYEELYPPYGAGSFILAARVTGHGLASSWIDLNIDARQFRVIMVATEVCVNNSAEDTGVVRAPANAEANPFANETQV